MKKILFLFLLALSISTVSAQKSFYDFKVRDIDGKRFSFNELRGKKVLIVNTASKCRFTPQFAELEKFYKENKDKNFVIIGFPSNSFAGKEPLTNDEIKDFCQKNYGVTFPMMSKISVTGNNTHPLYRWLTEKSLNGVQDSEVTWNFQKYLINEQGVLVKVLEPGTSVFTIEL